MKYKVLFSLAAVIAFYSFSSKTKDVKTIDLTEAVTKSYISFDFNGNTLSTHYYKPLLANITNKSKQAITIRIPAGYQFEATDAAYQNMMVTKTEIIKLNPNQNRKIEISAMCTEAGDRAPNEKIKYKPMKMAEGSLMKLANFIESKNYFNTEAQNAVWVLTNNRFVEDIAGFDTSCARSLQRFICKETNRKMPPPPPIEDYKTNYYSSNLQVTVGGMFEFKFSKPTQVTIAMFNKNNVVVRELYKNHSQPPGQHKISHEFDASVYTDNVYYFKLIADGRVLINRKLEMDN